MPKLPFAGMRLRSATRGTKRKQARAIRALDRTEKAQGRLAGSRAVLTERITTAKTRIQVLELKRETLQKKLDLLKERLDELKAHPEKFRDKAQKIPFEMQVEKLALEIGSTEKAIWHIKGKIGGWQSNISAAEKLL